MHSCSLRYSVSRSYVVRKWILILSEKILPLSLFIRVSLRSEVFSDFFKVHVYITHDAEIGAWEKGGGRALEESSWRHLQCLILTGLGRCGRWLSFPCPGSSIQKLPLVFLHHLSCEILVASPPCPAYKTEKSHMLVSPSVPGK